MCRLCKIVYGKFQMVSHSGLKELVAASGLDDRERTSNKQSYIEVVGASDGLIKLINHGGFATFFSTVTYIDSNPTTSIRLKTVASLKGYLTVWMSSPQSEEGGYTINYGFERDHTGTPLIVAEFRKMGDYCIESEASVIYRLQSEEPGTASSACKLEPEVPEEKVFQLL